MPPRRRAWKFDHPWGGLTTTAGSAAPAAIGPFLCSAGAPFLRPGQTIRTAPVSAERGVHAPKAIVTLLPSRASPRGSVRLSRPSPTSGNPLKEALADIRKYADLVVGLHPAKHFNGVGLPGVQRAIAAG